MDTSLHETENVGATAGLHITSVDDLHHFLDVNPVGESYEMTVLRSGTPVNLSVRPEEALSQEQ